MKGQLDGAAAVTVNVSGRTFQLARRRTCVIYDGKTGEIQHVHTVTTLGDIESRSNDEIEREALSLLEQTGRQLSRPKVLHLGESGLKQGVRFKVDVKAKSLLEIPEKRTRTKRAKK